MRLAVLGAGAWGTALAIALSRRHEVRLWTRQASQARVLALTRRNERYLPEVPLPAEVLVASDLGACVAGCDRALGATPTAALREVLRGMRSPAEVLPLVCACKGIETGTALLAHQIVAQELPGAARMGVLSGPSFALEVARGMPAALTLASRDLRFAADTARELHQATLRIYYGDDLVGVEIGGAAKNVMAIATGVCDGLGLGLNARAALITRGLAEIARLGTRVGGRPETFMGLAGAGDLILTCTGDLSRNRRVGLELAKGRALGEILSTLGHVSEGVASAREVQQLAARLGVDMPVTDAVCALLFRGAEPGSVVRDLLARDPRNEH
ncbi:MAG: NAD(P)-dependent glycerol-3-phosphate dehydrogenase [Burkholderiales bacterium]|nr:NAD(P)-dependent glycerol-3-phosphate dehydrogenase [Burkholderiales bacterium]